jgi:hypothetical protein
MSFLKRIGSVRKKGSYRLSAGPNDRPFSQTLSESATPKLPGGLVQCHVNMLDDSVFTCDLNVSNIIVHL